MPLITTVLSIMSHSGYWWTNIITISLACTVTRLECRTLPSEINQATVEVVHKSECNYLTIIVTLTFRFISFQLRCLQGQPLSLWHSDNVCDDTDGTCDRELYVLCTLGKDKEKSKAKVSIAFVWQSPFCSSFQW